MEKDRASVENGRAIIITTHNRNRRRQETNDDSHLSSKILSGTSGSRSRSGGSGSPSGGTSDTLNNSTMSAIERQRERDKEREKTQYVWEPPVMWESSLEDGNIDQTRTTLSRQEIVSLLKSPSSLSTEMTLSLMRLSPPTYSLSRTTFAAHWLSRRSWSPCLAHADYQRVTHGRLKYDVLPSLSISRVRARGAQLLCRWTR